MTGEWPPSAEEDRSPQEPLFNLAAMSNEAIIALNRGLTVVLEAEDQPDVLEEVSGVLLDRLAADVRRLAEREPDRVRDLMQECAASQNEFDRELAVDAASAVIQYDYMAARDALMWIYTNEDRSRSVSKGLASEAAGLKIPDLMRDYLTPEQIDDFNAHLAAHGRATQFPSPPDRP